MEYAERKKKHKYIYIYIKRCRQWRPARHIPLLRLLVRDAVARAAVVVESVCILLVHGLLALPSVLYYAPLGNHGRSFAA